MLNSSASSMYLRLRAELVGGPSAAGFKFREPRRGPDKKQSHVNIFELTNRTFFGHNLHSSSTEKRLKVAWGPHVLPDAQQMRGDVSRPESRLRGQTLQRPDCSSVLATSRRSSSAATFRERLWRFARGSFLLQSRHDSCVLLDSADLSSQACFQRGSSQELNLRVLTSVNVVDALIGSWWILNNSCRAVYDVPSSLLLLSSC